MLKRLYTIYIYNVKDIYPIYIRCKRFILYIVDKVSDHLALTKKDSKTCQKTKFSSNMIIESNYNCLA